MKSGNFVLGVIVEHKTGVVGGVDQGFFLRQVHRNVVRGVPFGDAVDGGRHFPPRVQVYVGFVQKVARNFEGRRHFAAEVVVKRGSLRYLKIFFF